MRIRSREQYKDIIHLEIIQDHLEMIAHHFPRVLALQAPCHAREVKRLTEALEEIIGIINEIRRPLVELEHLR